MKRIFSFIAVLSLVLAFAATSLAYEAFRGPLGVLTNKPNATKGYVLLCPQQNSKKTYLIDNNGNVVKEWTSEYNGFYAELLPNGNMVRMSRFDKVMLWDFGGASGILEEFDWNGKKVFEHVIHSKEDGVAHHTFEVMPNGNYLVLVWEYISYDDALKAGLDPNILGRNIFPNGFKGRKGEIIEGIWPDKIVEIDRKKNKIVWEWRVWDHLGTTKDKINVNVFLNPEAARVYAGPDWTHLNGVAYNPKTDEICFTSRNLGEVFVIKKSTGKIVFRWGNPANYGEGRYPAKYSDNGDQKLFGPHAPDWTPEGNITILDNGNNRPSGNYTRAVEINPKTGEEVWAWAPLGVKAPGSNFYSAYQCGAQKQLNGNWMITASTNGHVVEVTPDKEIVWEFVNPIREDKVYKTSSTHGASGETLHKALRYSTDWPGFKGKTLKPLYALPNWTKELSADPVPMVDWKTN